MDTVYLRRTQHLPGGRPAENVKTPSNHEENIIKAKNEICSVTGKVELYCSKMSIL